MVKQERGIRIGGTFPGWGVPTSLERDTLSGMMDLADVHLVAAHPPPTVPACTTSPSAVAVAHRLATAVY